MNRSDYVTKLISRDEWKLICQIRQYETCRRKITYLRESEAIAESIRLSSKTEMGGTIHRHYRCEICSHFHLTTKPLIKNAPNR